jgi:hypothetical protein
MKSGRSVIRCTDDIETQVQVVEFEGVSLKQNEELSYLIQPKFSVHDIEREKLKYVDDLTYRCTWDAPLCGSVSHEEVNGSHFCSLKLYDHRLCDERSILTVNVDSVRADLHLMGSTEVIHRKLPFGVPTKFTLSVNNDRSRVEFAVDVDAKDIFSQVTSGLSITFGDSSDGKTLIILGATSQFKKGWVLLEDKSSGERVNITVLRDRWRWSSVYLSRDFRKYDDPLFYFSVLCTLVFGGYIAYRLGAGGLLPPLSPYGQQ